MKKLLLILFLLFSISSLASTNNNKSPGYISQALASLALSVGSEVVDWAFAPREVLPGECHKIILITILCKTVGKTVVFFTFQQVINSLTNHINALIETH